MRLLAPARPGRGCRSRWIAAAAALLWLGACQSAGDPPAPVDGWRVVERLGHARFQPPGASEWLHVPAAGVVPEGSRVITGRGGRLILGDGGRQVVASTASDFRLPYGGDPAWLLQSAGPVRYRVLDGAVLIVETPFFEADVATGVLDVSVASDSAEVRVVHGKARVLTPDGRTVTTLEAGEAAAAERRGPEYRLARRGAAGALETVAPVLQPAAQSVGTAAKLGMPQARLLAEAAPSRADEVALGWSSPQQTAVVIEAVATPSPQRATLLANIVAGPVLGTAADFSPAPMASERQVVAQLAPTVPGPRLIRPTPARPSPPPGAASETTDTKRAIERWAELPTKKVDLVIVPARYPSAPTDVSDAEAAGASEGPGPGGEVQRPAAQMPARTGRPGAPADPRQIPFEQLGAGLLDGLAPAEIRARDAAGPRIVPARRL